MKKSEIVLVVNSRDSDRQVIIDVCRQLGYSAEFVPTTGDALHAILETDFLLILLTCPDPEPEISGHTHKLRLLMSAGAGCSIPIIGICKIIPEDLDEALTTAGLDGLIPLPFTPDGLKNHIKNWAARSPEPAGDPVSSPYAFPDGQQDEGSLSMKAVDELKLLLKEKYPAVLNQFFSTMDNMIAELQAGISAQDADQVRFAAHDIKSTARQFGAIKVSRIAMEIEKMADQPPSPGHDWQALAQSIDKLTSAYDKSRVALQASA